jgi:hypothetical protein
MLAQTGLACRLRNGWATASQPGYFHSRRRDLRAGREAESAKGIFTNGPANYYNIIDAFSPAFQKRGVKAGWSVTKPRTRKRRKGCKALRFSRISRNGGRRSWRASLQGRLVQPRRSAEGGQAETQAIVGTGPFRPSPGSTRKGGHGHDAALMCMDCLVITNAGRTRRIRRPADQILS